MAESDALIGQTIAQYRIIEKLGQVNETRHLCKMRADTSGR
jgi:hypothetical protein